MGVSHFSSDQQNHSNLEGLSVLIICFCKEDWATVPPQRSETVIATYQTLGSGNDYVLHTGPVGLVRYFPLIHEIIT